MTDDQLRQIFNNNTLCNAIPFYRYDLTSNSFRSHPQSKSLRFNSANNYLLAPIFMLHNKQPISMLIDINPIVDVGSNRVFSLNSEAMQSLLERATAYSNHTYRDYKAEKSVCFLSLFISASEVKEFKMDSNYVPVTNAALLQLFGNNLKNNGLIRDSDAKLFTGIYRHKEKEIYIKVTNYYNELVPDFNSDTLGFLCGYNFASVEEHLFLATYPILSSTFKDELSKSELDLFKIACNPFNFNTLSIKNKLKEIFTSDSYKHRVKEIQETKFREALETQERLRYESTISQAKNNIEGYVKRIQETEITLLRAQKDLCYLQNNPTKSNEILDYISNHKYILNYNLNGGNIVFDIRVPLAQFDTELAETLVKNLDHNSYVSSNVEAMKKLLRYLFVECKGTMYVGGMFYIDIESWSWNNRRLSSTLGSEERWRYCKENKMAYNFHLENFDCAGSYKNQIGSALNKHDLIAAIECIMAPYKCWNLADGAVFSKALGGQLQRIMAEGIECIEYNNKLYNITDYITACDKEVKKETTKSGLSGILKNKKAKEVAQVEPEPEAEEPEGGIRL